MIAAAREVIDNGASFRQDCQRSQRPLLRVGGNQDGDATSMLMFQCIVSSPLICRRPQQVLYATHFRLNKYIVHFNAGVTFL